MSGAQRIWPVGAPPHEPEAAPGPEPPRLADRLRASRYAIGIAVAFVLGINMLLLAAYVWSHGGQTTHIRVEARGDLFSAYVDGHLRGQARLAAADHGGIAITIGDTEQPPSLPKPRGLDSVHVLDLATGSVLFADEFPSVPSPTWEGVTGSAYIEDGVVGARGGATFVLANEPWRDYAVDATFRNGSYGTIMLRAQDAQTGVAYNFGFYREYGSGFAVLANGQPTQSVPASTVEMKRIETVKSLVAMVLEPYPIVFALLGIGFVCVVVLQLVSTRHLRRAMVVVAPAGAVSLAALVIFGFVATLYFNYSYGQHLPHVPDEVNYIFQAKLLAAAHLTAPLPPVQDAFDYFSPPSIIPAAGRWIGIYPFGHPLWLSIGVKGHALWLMPPFAGAASALLLFLIGRKVYGARVGLLATLLFVTSPFYLMTASNFMSHNTAALFLLGSLACIAYAKNSPLLLGVLGGLSFGLFFNTQSLSAVAVIAPLGLLLLSELLSREQRLPMIGFLGAFAAGAFVMLAAYFLYNHQTTGHAFTSGLQVTSTPGSLVLWGGANSPSIGIQNQQAQLSMLLLVLNGWPLYIGLSFVLLPFILATRHRWDWALLAAAVSMMGVYVLFIGHGIMHGPRFWYVAAPLLMLLSARGAEHAGQVLGDVAAFVRRSITGADVSARWAGMTLAYLLVAALVGSGIYGWLLGRHTGWADPLVPATAVELKGFNGVDDRLVKLVDDAHLHNALVLVQDDCAWQCYGSVFWKNAPTLDGDIVYARDSTERRAELLRLFPNRFVYLAHYAMPAQLIAYPSTGGEISAPRGPLQALRARDIVPAAATPTPAPGVEAALLRDQQRKRDLQILAGALQQYYDKHSTYPVAAGLQTLCVYEGPDAGCQLREVLDPLPRDPTPAHAYRYQSDGKSFVVEAIIEQPPSGASGCVPIAEVDLALVYCLRGASIAATPAP